MVIPVNQNTGVKLGETSTTAHRGDKGKIAYDHSQSTHAPIDAQKNSNITKAEIEAKLVDEITTHTHPGSRSGYGIIVYVSGSTYYAINQTGILVSSGATFSTVIQAAIDSLDPGNNDSGGEVRISAGGYTLTSGVIIHRNVRLILDKFAVIAISGNIDGFTIYRGASIEGGQITVSSGFTGNCIVVDGDDQIFSNNVNGIRDIVFHNPGNTGTAIYLKTVAEDLITEDAAGFIYGFIIENVRIWLFDYGIRFYQRTYEGYNWINGNKFKDVFMYHTNWGIHASASDETGASGVSDFMMNTFENINIQTRTHENHSHAVWRILGSNNAFRNSSLWDWPSGTGGYQYAIECSAVSSKNIFEWLESKNILQYVDDPGYLNTFKNITDHRDIPLVLTPHGQMRQHYGDPTLEEKVICPNTYKSQLRFVAPATQEQSTDGSSWTTSTRLSSNQLKVLVIGDGEGLADEAVAIWPAPSAGGSGYYRLTWNATSQYTILDGLYLYLNTGVNNITVKVEAYKNLAATWVTLAEGTVNQILGHVWVPFTPIVFRTGTSDSSYRGNIRVTLSVTNATEATAAYLMQAEWLGPYPHGKRHLESYDENKNVTFPAAIITTSGINGILFPLQSETADIVAGAELGGMYYDTELGYLCIGKASGVDIIASQRPRFARASACFDSSQVQKSVDSYTTLGIDTQAIAANGDYFDFYLWSDDASETILDITIRKTNGSSIFRVWVNGTQDSATTYDLYASTASNNVQSVTLTQPIIPGINKIQLQVTGKNASSSGYALGTGGMRIR